jgi:DNA-binding response OmpR family regulator
VNRRRVLVIEDEESISKPLSEALEREGFSVEIAATGEGGIDAASRRPPDIILLDLMLPDLDGKDVCRSIRLESSVPIIMLTARGLETDRVVGLELGADDYVVKPFGVAELVARMRAVMRRSAGAPSEPQDEITRREFELLRILMENSGSVLTRERLMEEVWDPNWFGPTKTLDVHISTLRRKLGDDPNDPKYIHTVRGVGFRFASVEELRR